MLQTTTKPPLTIRLCQPRGFCAGVDRAIEIVVLALQQLARRSMFVTRSSTTRYVVADCGNRRVFIEELETSRPVTRQRWCFLCAWRPEIGAGGAPART